MASLTDAMATTTAASARTMKRMVLLGYPREESVATSLRLDSIYTEYNRAVRMIAAAIRNMLKPRKSWPKSVPPALDLSPSRRTGTSEKPYMAGSLIVSGRRATVPAPARYTAVALPYRLDQSSFAASYDINAFGHIRAQFKIMRGLAALFLDLH